MNSYDQIPYQSYPFRQAHPDRIALVAWLMGLTPPDVRSARVLELGCASGGHLIPIAEQLPDSECLGIDGSRVQVAEGIGRIHAIGRSNIELRCQDILEFELEGAPFDYIICHGVFSWISQDVQNALLKIFRNCLSENGVGYISYNTFPGWRMRGLIRDIMRYRASSFAEPDQKLHQARGLLSFLRDSVETDTPYGRLLKNEVEVIQSSADSYLLHEHLEDVNEPTYFFQFAERLFKHGLTYVGEADYGSMSLNHFPSQARTLIESISRDRIEREQYLDFLQNRSSRQTLLCHSHLSPRSPPEAERLLVLRFASDAMRENEPKEKQPRQSQPDRPIMFRRRAAVLRTSDPVVVAAFDYLQERWPAYVEFPELAAIARSRIHSGVVTGNRSQLNPHSRSLADALLRCIETGMVDASLRTPSIASEVGETPYATEGTRWQAKQGTEVTDQTHRNCELGEVARFVLQHCDGNRTVDEIAVEFQQQLSQGGFSLWSQGKPITDPNQQAQAAKESVLEAAHQLARQCLLTVPPDSNTSVSS